MSDLPAYTHVTLRPQRVERRQRPTLGRGPCHLAMPHIGTEVLTDALY